MKKLLIVCAAAAAFALPAAAQDKGADGKLADVHPEGRSFTHNGKKYTVSGSRTEVMVDGKQADRSALKSGMACTVEGSKKGDEAAKVDCKTK